MAKRKKHSFKCASCGEELQIYKKGKGHRLLVCPKHGILAINPGLGALIGAGIGSIIPGAGTVAGGLAGQAIESGISYLANKKKKAPVEQTGHQYIVTDSKDKPNITHQDYLVHQVLKDERLI